MEHELQDTIALTLRRAARRNELGISRVRVLVMALFVMIELYWIMTPGGIDNIERIPTFVGLGLAVILWRALAAGWYRPWVGYAAPCMDFVFATLRESSTYAAYDVTQLGIMQESGQIMGIAGLITISGGFRMSRDHVLLTTGLGMGLVLITHLIHPPHPSVTFTHLGLISAVGVCTILLLHQVRQAIDSEVARQTLSRFLPPTVIDGAHDDPMALITTPREVEATVLITDIRGFTTWAEDRDPIDVLAKLNKIQGTLARIVREHGGLVDKFLGDGMLAVFGAPETTPEHATQAISAVQEILRLEHDDLKLGIAVHTGPVVVGCLGSGLRLEFTVLGDTVNTTSRLEAATKQHGVPCLISGTTVNAINGAHGLQHLGSQTMRGRTESIELYTPKPTPTHA